jgi:ureidoglycolate lyase
VIKPEPLSPDVFKPFGDVIECSDRCEQQIINYGHTTRFHDLAAIDVNNEKGKPLINIFRTEPIKRPVSIEVMERHLLSSQTFYPLGDEPYLVVVADKGEFSTDNIKVFLASSNQGVNYHAGVWHHYSLALNSVSDFLVIDRGGAEENCDEVKIKDETILIDY